MRPAILSALLVLAIALGTQAQAPGPSLTDRAKHATAILVAQNESGGMDVRCTATAFEKHGDSYRFISAAHCIGDDDRVHEKVASAVQQSFYITFDNQSPKIFYEAKPRAIGYQSRGDDCAVFDVTAPKDAQWPTVPLGDEKHETEGNDIINVAAPLGLGIQLFKGTISSMSLDRPVVSGEFSWKGFLQLQLSGVAGGSSGSAVISLKQNAIVGLIIGTIGGNQIVAVPISRLKDFMDKVDAGTYKWARKDEDQVP